MIRPLPALAAAMAFAAWTSAAHASLRLCNNTSYVLYAATASATTNDIFVQGWTRIVPGVCSIAIKGDLAASAYYLYARSSPAHAGAPRAWSGQTNLCVRDTNFSLHAPLLTATCPASDMFLLPFAAIATHHMRSWTTTLRETPDFPSIRSAQRAGLKRLLRDIGARPAQLANDKTMDAALADFRERMHISDKAGTSALFDALETEAMKTAAPAGYTVCNDTAKPVWAALGQKKGAVYVSRGWWTVSAGGCARTISDSVANTKIYLRVEKSKGKALISGPMNFCVTNIEFEIQGRERCGARGLTEAGFAETNANGAPGFTAHVTDGGLAPVFTAGIGTSK